MSERKKTPKKRLGCSLSPDLIDVIRVEAALAFDNDTSALIESELRKSPKIRRRLAAIKSAGSRMAQAQA